ncbi:hypothetical protein LCGC14_0709460 [marine sediment metagenome]|uniref:Uncharacterized protein n=1 Tax=marine sediment metagenome TaxID=412755 RepID=A0A0F9QK43_9ZZZZ
MTRSCADRVLGVVPKRPHHFPLNGTPLWSGWLHLPAPNQTVRTLEPVWGPVGRAVLWRLCGAAS